MGFFDRAPNVAKLAAKKDIQGLVSAMHWHKDAKGGDDYSKAWAVRNAAAEALSSIGDPRAVEPLISVLKEDDHNLSDVAANLLGEIGDPRAAEPLAAAVCSSRYSNVIKAATTALCTIGAPSVEHLVARLKNRDGEVRCRAAKALATIGDPRAINPLVEVLKDNESYVRSTATEALNQLGWKPDSEEDKARDLVARRAWKECAELGAPAVEPLIGALADRTIGVARTLGMIGDSRSIEPLIRSFKSGFSEAAEGLCMFGDDRAIEALTSALEQVKPEADTYYKPHPTAEAAAGALGKIGARDVKPLVFALENGPYRVRKLAARALGTINDPAAVVPLIASLAAGLEEAADALGEIGDAGAVEPLIIALKDSRKYMREAAVRALGSMGEAAVGPLRRAVKNGDVGVREAAARVLGAIGDPQAVAAQKDVEADISTRLNAKGAKGLFPQSWCSGDGASELLRIIESDDAASGNRCPYAQLGVCMFRVETAKDASFGPEECSWKGRAYTGCSVYVQAPK